MSQQLSPSEQSASPIELSPGDKEYVARQIELIYAGGWTRLRLSQSGRYREAKRVVGSAAHAISSRAALPTGSV